MDVVVFAPYYPPAVRAGGPVKSISALVSAGGEEFDIRVVTRNRDLGTDLPLSPRPDAWVAEGRQHIWRWGARRSSYVRAIRVAFQGAPRIVYVNSLFDPWSALLPALLWRAICTSRSVLVVAPRGQLAATALSRSALKKRALLTVWRVVVGGGRVVLHAASTQEQREIMGVLRVSRVVVRSNEVGALSAEPRAHEHAASGVIRAVFLGRLVPIKGLLELLVSLREATEPLTLDVFGPEEDHDYVESCHAAALALPSSVAVTFRGPLANEDVLTTLARYDVMLNPTRGESFGQAIGEGLSAGVPVAVPPVTPWTDRIERSGGGWIVRDAGWARLVDAIALESAGEAEGRRRAARGAYEDWWHSAQGEPHVFRLALEEP